MLKSEEMALGHAMIEVQNYGGHPGKGEKMFLLYARFLPHGSKAH